MTQHPITRRLIVLLACLAGAVEAAAQPATPRMTDSGRSRTAGRPVTPDADAARLAHPLDGLLHYARAEREYLQAAVRDFTCRLVKRERVDGELQNYHYIDVQARQEPGDDKTEVALSVYLDFLSPESVAGRKVLYVDGQNDGKMLVRKGGRRLSYVVVKIDPNGASARRESRVPVTCFAFCELVDAMIGLLEEQIEADPTGDNTQVQLIKTAKIDGRPCSVIRVVHPRRQPELHFHRADVFIDSQLHAPVRVEAYDWPEEPGESPLLMAEYTYTDLKLNVNLSDSTFDPSVVRGKRGE